MYGGFKIIDCKNTATLSIISEYTEHKSIAYGCDWSFLNSEEISEQILKRKIENVFLTSTCSFYDHILKVSALYLNHK